MDVEDQDDWFPPEPPVVVGLERPRYAADPGTGVNIHVHAGEVYLAVYWDGACRRLLHVTPDEMQAVNQTVERVRWEMKS